MSDKKFYQKLPAVQQTAAIKNFFESTVEQLFSQANSETVQGFIGSQRNEDVGVNGKFLTEPTVTKRFYGLSPTVNTINDSTGTSENLVFYDEFIDTLKTYGVDVKNQNKIFNEGVATFMPPINVDKLMNYSEYYWYPRGPKTIIVEGTAENPIDIARDIAEQKSYTTPGGVTLRNGMVIEFRGEYVIPQSRTFVEYVVEGVGDNIILLLKNGNFSTRFTSVQENEYDLYDFTTSSAETRHSAGNVDIINVGNGGIGYVAPSLLIYDDSITTDSTLISNYPDAVSSYIDDTGSTVEYIAFERLVDHLTANSTTSEYTTIKGILDANRANTVATTTTITDDNGAVSAEIDTVGEEYFGDIRVRIYDTDLTHTVNVSATVALMDSNVSVTDTIVLETASDVKVGQQIVQTENNLQAVVTDITGLTVTIDRVVPFNETDYTSNNTVRFSGRNFLASAEMTDTVTKAVDSIELLSTQARLGVNPNNANDYYFLGGDNSWDKDLTGDGVGDVGFAGAVTEGAMDYIVQRRGAFNQNVWSRVNFWYHRDNFLDAGDEIPDREFRANRPIIEFDRYTKLYNHGAGTVGSVTIASTAQNFDQVDGIPQEDQVDGVPVTGATMIFTGETATVNKHIYNTQQVLTNPVVTITGDGTGATATVEVQSSGKNTGTIISANVTNGGSGYTTATITVASEYGGTGATFTANISAGAIQGITVDEGGLGYYARGTVRLLRVGDPATNPDNTIDGEVGFVPYVMPADYTVQIVSGEFNIGKEYIYNGTEWSLAQEKTGVNQAPLFMLYDSDGVALDDTTKYPNSTFTGNKIFGYATELPSTVTDVVVSPIDDPELGFPLVYRQFKASSEIVFNNFMETTYSYTPIGSTTQSNINGYLYYATDLGELEYNSYWKILDNPHAQRIVTTYNITQLDVDRQRVTYSIGCIPDTNVNLNSGYDIRVYVNGVERTDFTYGSRLASFIDFDTFTLAAGDFVEVSAYSTDGVITTDNSSKFELPLGWGHNIFNEDITYTSEPEYLPHFAKYITNQIGLTGEPLGSNNFDSTPQDKMYATDIVQTNQDLVLGAYLIDDQPHNLVDALRFNAQEYIKYKNRLRSEVEKLYSNGFNSMFTPEQNLEQVLRNVISFKVGREVFNRTYILPFGDNYTQEEYIAALDQTEFTLTMYADLDQVENSLLIYRNGNLMCVDRCYVITDFNPITIQVQPQVGLVAGDVITAKLYNDNRDSAQCPPTPSVLGITPIFQPEILIDNTYSTPIEVLVGHDGSRTPTYGDDRDQILLDFERRIYNSAKADFREKNSQLDYNLFEIRSGAFRSTGYSYKEWHDLLNHYYAIWTSANGVDPLVNEFYDENDEWTWNYRSDTIPGYWKGVYEFYYDTQRPNSHPWEMLGFTEKPLWWEEQYGTSYTSYNGTMWDDLEQGIIRQGPRENFSNESYLLNNPYRRLGLFNILPVDSNGDLVSPARLFNTGTTTVTDTWTNADTGNHDPDFEFRTSEYLNIDGVNISHDTGNIYVQSKGILNHALNADTGELFEYETLYGDVLTDVNLSYTIPRKDLNIVSESPTAMTRARAVGVLVNGIPVYSNDYGDSWNNEDEWHYDETRLEDHSDFGYIEASGGFLHYHTVPPEAVGLEEWDSETHSPIVGWALDGIPIYGPYGYSDVDDINSDIIMIKSPWVLRSGTRSSGPGGAHTGVFIEDYRLDSVLESSTGYTNRYNLRYGFTPDSTSQKIWHYVVTLKDDGTPAFPYHVGGGVKGVDTWAGNFYSTPRPTGAIGEITIDDEGGLYTTATITVTGDGTGAVLTPEITDGKITGVTIADAGQDYTYATATVNGDGVRAKISLTISDQNSPNNSGYVNESATPALTSTNSIVYSVTGNTSDEWLFSDGAPVENAWKQSEGYQFAIAEALLLARPGRFATIFSDPTLLYRPAANPKQLLCTLTNKRWKFTDPDQFAIHGDTDSDGNFITNIGYTQFINSWLSFQGLSTVDDFVTPMRTLNMKLAHRMNGYIDKDTMVLRTDQYSSSGEATSLIIPQENIDVTLHASNYKSRNYYTGVIVEKTVDCYRVKGYDRSRGYFLTLESDTNKGRSKVSVGGEPADHVNWEPSQTYRKGTIVEHLGNYYVAPVTISSGDSFERSLWERLPSLPQVGAASATLYQETTGIIKRVDYQTEFVTEQEVYDFLISLGRYQEYLGYDFGEFSTEINDVSNWQYSAKQFLFWTTGKWEIGNTIELSPMASKAKFVAPVGFIAKLNRNEREQFSIVDFEGAVIDPKECLIERHDDSIVITPPTGKQIYGVMLFVKEIEHALVVDNITQFNDVIYDPVIYQKHSRLKLKATRTLGWTGKLLSSGFIIDGDELLPNLDNQAQSMGRYHELGFVPVEKQVYEQSRAMYGYTEREYLRELDVLDEEQFDFYRGMIQSKGTNTSLSRIARSSAIVDGNVTVFDEWALRVGDFGDTENQQSVELRLTKSELVQDPQLVQLALPEDVTNIVESVDVIEARYTYTQAPTIEISSPTLGGVPASAQATLAANGKISAITVTSQGQGFNENTACVKIIAANVVTDARDTVLTNATIMSNVLPLDSSNISFTLTDHISGNANVNLTVDNGNANVTAELIVDAINTNASLNTNIIASSVETHTTAGNVAGINYNLILTGSDFTVEDGNSIVTTEGRYQPRQRYQLDVPLDSNISISDSDGVGVEVYLDNVLVDTSEYTVYNGNIITVTSDDSYPRTDGAGNLTNTSATFSFTGDTLNADSLEINEVGRYRYAKVFINDVQIQNINGDESLFTLNTGNIVFPDVSRLPRSVMTPLYLELGETQLSTVFGFTDETEIRIEEASAFEFVESFKGDIPGKTLFAKITTNEGIAVRMGKKSLYGVTTDNPYDDVITIDIDDNQRFLKKPIGEVGENLWPTTLNVDATGITDSKYTTPPNAGYVYPGDVNFRAFDIASIPDLFSTDTVLKPYNGSLIHVASAENTDWNVYKLNKIQGDGSFVSRSADGKVSLLTNYSLFNYLDTNQIGEANTGKYLDYYLTLKNAQVTDNVVVWRNEEIIQNKQFTLNDFKSPQMIEARIASIGPHNLTTISDITPEPGRKYNSITLTPVPNTDTVTVSGLNFTELQNQDRVRLIDNTGTVSSYNANLDATGNTITIHTNHVSNVVINSGGAGFTTAPNVVFSASATSSEYDRARGNATIEGNVSAITVVDNGEVINPTVLSITGDGTGAEATARSTNATVVGFIITDTGYGYDSNALPNVTITGANTSTATAEITIADVDEAGAIIGMRIDDAGAGYDASNITVTIDAPASGRQATATAVLEGNVAVTVTDAGSGYTYPPVVEMTGDGITSATAELNATVTGVVISSTGAGYSGTATITFDGANSTPVNATVNMNTGVTELNTLISEKGNGNVAISLTGEADANLAFRVSPALSSDELATLNSVNNVLQKQYLVQSVNPTNGSFTIVDDTLGNATILSNIVSQGYAVTTYQDFDANSYLISNVTPTTFDIERANTVASSNVSIMHLNKSKIEANAHPYSVGDIIRVSTNTIRGMYTVESATANNIVIPAKFVPGFVSGDIIQEGLEITTAGDHGITRLYGQSGKRIAVHFAEPLYYNKVYPIGQVTGDKIIVDNYWPKDRRTHTFYEERSSAVNGSIPYEAGNISADYANATNIIDITSDVRLNDFIAIYNSNSAVVSPGHITFSGNIAIISTAALPANTSISTDITIIRQQLRESNRYPTLTTLDHNKAMINGALVEVDSYNNPQAVANSIERNIRLRESFTDTDSGKFNLQIAMLKNPNTKVLDGLKSNEISDYGPYVKDAELINKLSNGELTVTGSIDMGDEDELTVDSNFRQDNATVGPVKGLTYVDDSDIEWMWSPALGRYRAVNSADVLAVEEQNHNDNVVAQAPEYHVDSFDPTSVISWVATTQAEIDADATPSTTVAYFAGSLVTYNNVYYTATSDIVLNDNTAFSTGTWYPVTDQASLSALYAEHLILKRVPGTATYSSMSDNPGVKRRYYNMLQTVSFSGSRRAARYRLKANDNNLFYVYEVAQNDDGDIYYILVDKSAPPTQPHDYFSTVNRYSTFAVNTYSGDTIVSSVLCKSTDYYYNNNILPSVNGSNQITNTRDPIRLKNAASIVELPPVEPAAYVGKQIIAEPFAVSGGNNSDAEYNFIGMPNTTVGSPAPDERAVVSVESPGFNSFLLWTAGVTSGEYKPTSAGPGQLKGYNNATVSVGYGSGYYSANGTYPTGYPVNTTLTYDRPIQRMVYTGTFSVHPPVKNYDSYIYVAPDGATFTEQSVDSALDSGSTTIGGYSISDLELTLVAPTFVDSDNEIVSNYGLRPEEIWVACFWTEPHIYANQLVGWNYNQLDASGYPTPVYADYSGTVARFKYIRLTELPDGVITRRPIPDTGWAGKEWVNKRVDDVDFSEVNEDEIWTTFAPQTRVAGSTGDEQEAVSVNVGDVETTSSATTANGATGGIPDAIINSIPAATNNSAPTTEVGPVLTAGILEGLPGPCTAPADPFAEPVARPSTNCHTKEPIRISQYVSNTSDSFIVGSEDNEWGFIKTKIVGRGDFRVFFDFRNKSDKFDGAGITIVQSNTEYPANGSTADIDAWWGDIGTISISDTRNDGTSKLNNGEQIGTYGSTPFNIQGQVEAPTVNTILGLTQDDITSNTTIAKLEADAVYTRHIKPYGNASIKYGVSGIGFLVRYGLDCSNGDHITIFVSQTSVGYQLPPPTDNAFNRASIKGTPVWDMVIDHQTEKRVISETEESTPCIFETSPSRAYQQGAVMNEWRGTNNRSYFGTESHKGEFTGKSDKDMDNIYFPYNRSSSVIGWSEQHGTNFANSTDPRTHAGSGFSSKLPSRIVRSMGEEFKINGQFRTIEIKGYFRAPVTGWYRFGGTADDSMWMWLSSSFEGFGQLPYSQSATMTSNPTQGYMKRYGVSETGIKSFDGTSAGREYFTEDGSRVPTALSRRVVRSGNKRNQGAMTWTSDEYMESPYYHRDNCVMHTGWMSTKHRNRDVFQYGINSIGKTFQSEVYVHLTEGEMYFTRLIMGNSNGPAYAKVKYNVVDTNISGTVDFSGRWCPEDNPPIGANVYIPGGDPEQAETAPISSADAAYLACTESKGIDSQVASSGITYQQAECYFESYNNFHPSTPNSMKDAIITTSETLPDFATNMEFIERLVQKDNATTEQEELYNRWVASGKPAVEEFVMTPSDYTNYVENNGAPIYDVEIDETTGTTYNDPGVVTTPSDTTSSTQTPEGTLITTYCETMEGMSGRLINTGMLVSEYADGRGGSYTTKTSQIGRCMPGAVTTGGTGGNTGGTGGTGGGGRDVGVSWDLK